MCSFPDLVILERSLTVAAQCFGAAIHDALHMIYTCPPSLRDSPTVRLYSAWMNVESIVAVVGILIVILAAVYIWLVRSGHGD